MHACWRRLYSQRASIVALVLLVGCIGMADRVLAADANIPAPKEKKAPAAKKAAPKGQASKKSQAALADKPKDCRGEVPKIEKVQPDEGKAGAKVTITGTNFGAPGCLSMVSFGPGSPAKYVQKDDSTITATVPEAKKGLRLLTVNTVAGQDSKPFLVR